MAALLKWQQSWSDRDLLASGVDASRELRDLRARPLPSILTLIGSCWMGF